MPDPVIVPEVPRQPPPDPVPSEQPPTPAPVRPEVPAPSIPNAPQPVETPESEPLGVPAPQPDDVPDPGSSEPLEIPSSSPPEFPSDPQGPSETTMLSRIGETVALNGQRSSKGVELRTQEYDRFVSERRYRTETRDAAA